MEKQIARYLEIKEAMEKLERERKALSVEFAQALETETPQWYIVNSTSYKLSMVERETHIVDYKNLYAEFPEIYRRFITDKMSRYPEVRKASRK